jgi:hypothetical protein
MKVYSSVDVTEFENSKVLIYPNPVLDNFIVEIQTDESLSDQYDFKLLDTRARVLREMVFEKYIKVERENLADGVYIIQISSAKGSHQQKIIFE